MCGSRIWFAKPQNKDILWLRGSIEIQIIFVIKITDWRLADTIAGKNCGKIFWSDILSLRLFSYLEISWLLLGVKYYVTFLLEIDHEVLGYGEISKFSVFFIQSNFDRMHLLSKNTLLEHSPQPLISRKYWSPYSTSHSILVHFYQF